MTGPDGARFPPRVVLAVAVASVGVSAILVREVHDAPSQSIAFYRLLFTTLLLVPPALIWHRGEFAQMTRNDLLVALGTGVVLALHFATWIESLFLTTVASSVIIVSTEAGLAAIGAAVFLGEKMPLRHAAFLGLAFLGVALIALGDAGLGGIAATPRALYGDLLAFVGAIAAAAYFVSGRRLRRRLHLLVYVLPVYASCTITLLLLVLVRDAPLAGFAPRTWGLLLLMALFPGVGGHTLFNWCLRYVPAATVGTAILGEPLIATVLAAILYTEIPGPLAIVGGLLTVVGIVAVVRARAAPLPLPPP